MTLRNSARGAVRDHLGEWREHPARTAASSLWAAAATLGAALAVAWLIFLLAPMQAL